MQYVRLKPFNGKQHKLQRYTVFGIKFEESKGWYEVPDEVAAYCATVKQVQDSPDSEFSADAFDVVATLEEARAIDTNERAKATRKTADEAERVIRPNTVRRTGAQPRATSGDLTTADLNLDNVPVAPKRAAAFDEQAETFPEDGEPLNPGPASFPEKTIESDGVASEAVVPGAVVSNMDDALGGAGRSRARRNAPKPA